MSKLSYSILALGLVIGLAACNSAQNVDAAPKKQEPKPAASSKSAAPASEILSKSAISNPCFFTSAEVTSTLGYRDVVAKADSRDLEAYGIASCRYEGSNGTLQVNLIWIDAANLQATKESAMRMSAGSKETIANDPDGAWMQYQGELGGALHYFRKNVMVEIRPLSWRESKDALKAKLLSLKRVP